MNNIERLIVGEFNTNCYLLYDKLSKKTLIIDPGDDPDYIISSILKLNLKPFGILATHGHFDHILGAFEVQKAFKIPFMINKNDLFLLKDMSKRAKYFLKFKSDPSPDVDKFLYDGLKIRIGDNEVKVIETPGHTPGSISLYIRSLKVIFVGDLVFEGKSLGRTDFKYSCYEDLIKSLKKIVALPINTVVYPGHGNSIKIKTLL
ncbi:MAG TPA: MBL fold metallo-hydrolase [Patescibacteria group bacterium]|nr:MBL fold metallo-hydrolase [Patescibacteria group bacterium]